MKFKKFIAGILCMAIAVMSIPLSSIAFSVSSASATEFAYLDGDAEKTKLYADNVTSLVNDLREENGLEPLKVIPLLQENAQLRAVEISEVFDHERPDGSSCFSAISSSISYSYVGENIAAGNVTPEKTVTQWSNSSGHRANMLSSEFTHIGVGVYRADDGTMYWVQMFIKARGTVSNDYTPVYQEYLPASTTAATTSPYKQTERATDPYESTTGPYESTYYPEWSTTSAYEDTTYPPYEDSSEEDSKSTEGSTEHSIVETGTCGENLTYTLDSEGLLTISGTGEIYSYAFEDRTDIKSVIIEDGVTGIGYRAFYDCYNLTSVTIPDSVTSIGDSAFIGCSSLTNIEVDANNKYYSSIDGNLYNKDATTVIQYAKGKTDESFTIPDSVTSIGDYAFAWSGLTSVTIPDSVTSIGDYAFRSCSSLTSVTIPDSVTSIGDSAFIGCSSLTNIEVDANNKYYSSIDGNLYNKDATTIIQYAKGKTDETFTIPDSVTSIGDYAFASCYDLTSVTIPDSVTSIGDSAFAWSGLTSVTIPDSVTSIGNSAFYCCYNLKDVYYNGTKSQWNNIYIESWNSCLTNATIHCSDGTLNATEETTAEPRGTTTEAHSLPDIIYTTARNTTRIYYETQTTAPDTTTAKTTTNATISDKATIKIGNVVVSESNIGKTVDVPVKIVNNPGFAVTGIAFIYDSSIDFCNLTSGFVDPAIVEGTGCVGLTSASQRNRLVDGTLYTLKLKLPSNASVDDVYSISGSIKLFQDENGNDISVTIQSGSITVVADDADINTDPSDSVLLCDTNQDGEINVSDAVYLNKFLINATSLTKNGLQAANCYNDGNIDSNDVLVILKYLAMTYTYSDLPIFPY